MKSILVGSTYFFKGLEGFKSKDTDRIILVDNPVGFKNVRQTTGSGACLFEWRKMTSDEFVEFTLQTKLPMSVGKFLVPEFCEAIGFTIKHLKKLKPVFKKLDDKHKYEKVIYESYIENGDFTLTEEQRLKAYEVYKKYRENDKEEVADDNT